MIRTAFFGGVIATLLVGAGARADDEPSQSPPPPNAVQSESPPPPAPPPSAVQSESPPPSAPPPSAVQSMAPEDAEAILGQRVMDAGGQQIGRLVDVLVDEHGQPQAAVIDFGGFMGIGNRKIAVHWSALRFNPADAAHKITVEMTPDQIQAAPEFRNPDKAASVVTPADPTPSPR